MLNKINHIRQLTVVFLSLIFAFPLSAQEMEDSVCTFKFLTGKDGFFAPGLNNGTELTRLFDFVDQYKKWITGHEMMLYVDGYYASGKSKAENLAIAKTRSNRVKSELITRKGLKENNFITKNHAGQGNFVLVRIGPAEGCSLPQMKLPATPVVADEEEENEVVLRKEPQAADTIPAEPEPEPECTAVVEEVVGNSESSDSLAQSEPVQQAADTADNQRPFTLRENVALKTNLLDYAILMPNLEIEWMFAKRWSVALEGQRAWYGRENPHKVYRVGTVIPEVRFWAIDRSKWHGMYVGIFGGGGMYDWSKNGKKGHEGEGGMIGASAGYMWPISKHLSLEAGIGVGYMRLRDKVYVPQDGHFLYQLTKNINYFGPLRLKLSLVWRIQSKKYQSGK